MNLETFLPAPSGQTMRRTSALLPVEQGTELICDATWSLYKQITNKPVPESSGFAFFTRKTKACLGFDLGQPLMNRNGIRKNILAVNLHIFMGSV